MQRGVGVLLLCVAHHQQKVAQSEGCAGRIQTMTRTRWRWMEPP